MAYKVNFSPESQEDLEKLADYIRENFYSDKIARKAVSEILDGVDNLVTSPLLGLDFDKKIGRRIDEVHETRMLILGRNLVFYLVNTETDETYVLRILDARQDYMLFIGKIADQIDKKKEK